MSKDLMFRDEIEALVSDSYSALESPDGPVLVFYSEDQLEGCRTALNPGLSGWATR